MSTKNDFPHKTNEWIEEEVEIPSFEPVVNEKMKRVEFRKTTRKATRKTMYAHSEPRKLLCKSGEHFFYPKDKKKSLFACNSCGFHKIAYPVTYKYNPDTGQLIHKITKRRV